MCLFAIVADLQTELLAQGWSQTAETQTEKFKPPLCLLFLARKNIMTKLTDCLLRNGISAFVYWHS